MLPAVSRRGSTAYFLGAPKALPPKEYGEALKPPQAALPMLLPVRPPCPAPNNAFATLPEAWEVGDEGGKPLPPPPPPPPTSLGEQGEGMA